MPQFKLGFIINPIAGIGGSVALKGSDGMALHALALGATPKANERAKVALDVLLPYKNSITIYTASGDMGENCARELGFNVQVVYRSSDKITTHNDTEATVYSLIKHQVDIILFAGGDGTAINIAAAVNHDELNSQVPVLGIPAGCKIHSGVYAITPKAAGRIIEMMCTKQLITLTSGAVVDIDENLFRQGIVKTKRYGEMQIPSELRYIQSVKSGGLESDELVLQDISADIIDSMDDELFLIGSGSTTAFLMEELSLKNTLLGVDLVKKRILLASDVTETKIWDELQQHLCKDLNEKNSNQKIKLVITLIGGQGHIFGRGNQQLSPRIIKAIIGQEGGKNNIIIIATKGKLSSLNNKPLISDTGDSHLDQILSGYMPITTGYHDQVLYPVESPL